MTWDLGGLESRPRDFRHFDQFPLGILVQRKLEPLWDLSRNFTGLQREAWVPKQAELKTLAGYPSILFTREWIDTEIIKSTFSIPAGHRGG